MEPESRFGWEIGGSATEAEAAPSTALQQLAEAVSEAETAPLRVQRGDGASALVVPWSVLEAAVGRGRLSVDGHVDLAESDSVVFLSAADNDIALDDLRRVLSAAGIGQPLLIGVPADQIGQQVTRVSTDVASRAVVARLWLDGDRSNRPFDLFKPSPARADSPAALAPLPEKIPEGPGNLRRREEWFQRRAGGQAS